MSKVEEYRKAIADLVKANRSGQVGDVISSRVIDWLSRNQSADIDTVKRELELLFGKEMKPYIARSLAKFKSLHDDVNDIYSQLGVKLEFEADKLLGLRAVSQIRYGQYSEAQLRILKRDITKGLTDNVGLAELKKRVKAAGGRVSFYGDTVAGTQYSGYGQAMKNEKANIAGIGEFEYVGNLRVTSRPFCQKHLGKIYTKEQIMALDNDPDLGTAGIRPVLIYKGGWNCAHDWEPAL